MNLYIKHLKKQYVGADRETKSKLLDELCQLTGYHRKHAISLLSTHAGAGNPLSKVKRGCKKTYDPNTLLAPLKQIWFATDQMCGKRLKSVIPLWLPFYGKNYGNLDDQVKSRLLAMSSASIDRMLQPIRNQCPKRLCGTKPGSLLKKHIPVKTDQWNESQPGFFEADTVAHCGTSLMGDFVWSITFTDICTCWTENRAVWGKGERGVLEQIKHIEAHLPFPVLGFDSDNGNEFLNWHLVRHFQERDTPVQFTRSRPYHSDDNAHVEQKNWTHVRHLLGYHRIDNPAAVELINDLYINECSLLRNYFYPTIKLIEKKRVNAKIIKRYEKTPKTPYQRIMESPHVDQITKDRLTSTFNTLDPFALNEMINNKLKRIFALVDLQLRGRDVAI